MLDTVSNFIAGAVSVIVILPPLLYPHFRTWLDRRIIAGVDHKFQERLEVHKHQLQLAAEEARFDYQRRLHDLNLLADKRHHVYAELWSHLRTAEGNVFHLIGWRYVPSFEDYNETDIEAHIQECDFPDGMREEVLALWGTHRTRAVKIIRKYTRTREIQLARASRQRAVNFWVLNELYLSKGVSDRVANALELLSRQLAEVDSPFGSDKTRERVTPEQFSDEMDALRNEMQLEIASAGNSAALHSQLADVPGAQTSMPNNTLQATKGRASSQILA